MIQISTEREHLLNPHLAVEKTIDPCHFSTLVPADSGNVIVRRAAIEEAEGFVLIRHRSHKLGEYYGDCGVRSSCCLGKCYALMFASLASLAQTTTSCTSARLITSCAEIYDSVETISVLLPLQIAPIGLVLHARMHPFMLFYFFKPLFGKTEW